MLSRLSIRTLLIGGAALVALIPAAILGIESAQAVRSLVLSAALHDNELLARGLASEYEQFLTLHLQAVQQAARHVEAARRLDAATLQPIVVRARASHPALIRLLAIDLSGKTIAADPLLGEGKSTLGVNYSDREWFKRVIDTRGPFVDRSVIVGRTVLRPTVAIVSPVMEAGGRLAAVLVAGLDLDRVAALAARIRVGETGYAQAAAADGLVVTHRDAELVRQRKDFSKMPIWPFLSAAESGQIASYTGTRGDDRIAGFATVGSTGWKVWVNQARAEIEGRVRAVYRRAAAWGALGLLVTLGLAAALSGGISRPVRALGATASLIAGGELARTAPERGPREISSLARAFNRMASALRETLIRERASRAALERSVVEIHTAIEELRQTAQSVAREAGQVAESAGRTAEVSRQGQSAVEESIKGMQETQAHAQATGERILALSEHGRAIGDIIASVADLAEQSNVLAVNAAIEAASAGEAGKGFAVVAAEVKTLAGESRRATTRVRAILDEIQRATQAAVMAAEQGAKRSQAGAAVAARAGESIRVLAESVAEAERAAQHILVAARQQAAGTDQIALAMQGIQQARDGRAP